MNEKLGHRRAGGGDPTRTVHFAVARKVSLLLGVNDKPGLATHGNSLLAWSISDDATTPGLTALYARTVADAWALVSFGCGVAMVLLGYLAQQLFGAVAARDVVNGAAGCAFFCLGGCVNALWCKHYAKQARRHARKSGTADTRYAKSMHRALPRNSSLVFQSAFGVLAAVVS